MSKDRVETLFAELLESDNEQRAAKLAALDDPKLQAEVAALLDVAVKADGFLSLSPVASVECGESVQETLPGRQIGTYRIVQELGQGGMGTVFLAERADGQFEQQVAIKLMNYNVATESMESMSRYFHRERQILASLQHANIAGLLDGGMTASGQPYLVMEYIRGEPIDDYCRSRQLPLYEKIKLFCSVCDAVQYAHQNLIVHRDLKPANILVTAEGIPKLLDFGIAKMLDAEQSSDSAATQMLMTPEYAAPEQITGAAITTATDVYALGVILYQILTEQRPYDLKNHCLASIVQAVCEADAVTPSKVVVSAAEKKQLSGDLDNIVLNTLHKEPAKRYGSVDQLANDLHYYLDGFPVLASGNGLGYRTKKFLHRHKHSVASAALVVIALLVGITTTTWQWQIAQLERERTEQSYVEVRELANTIVFELSDAIAELPGATRLRQSLLSKGLHYLDRLAQERSDDTTLMLELARAYHRLAGSQGNPFSQNLGDSKGALNSYEKALQIYEKLLQHDPSNKQILLGAAENYRLLSGMYGTQGELTKAQALASRAVELLEPYRSSSNRKVLNRLIHGYLVAAHWFNVAGDYNTAMADAEQAQLLFEQNRFAPNKLGNKIIRARMLEELAAAYAGIGKLDKALQLQRRFIAVAQSRTRKPGHERMVARAYHGLGQKLVVAGQFEQARASYDKALQLWQQRVEHHPDDLRGLRSIAGLYAELGILHSKIARATPSAEHADQQSCALLQRSQDYLQRLPALEMGYGAHHPGLPKPVEVENIVSSVCVKQS